MNSHSRVGSTAGSLLINVLYILGALVGLLVGAYGTLIFVVAVMIIVVSDLYIFGLIFGLPLIIVGFGYLAFVSNMLFRSKYKKTKYSPRVWVPALLGLVGVCLLGYIVFLSLRRI